MEQAMKKIVIVNDAVLGRQIIYDATKNERRPVGGNELVGMVVVDVNRNALGEIVLFLEMPGEGRKVASCCHEQSEALRTAGLAVQYCSHGQPKGEPCEGCTADLSDAIARQQAKDQRMTADFHGSLEKGRVSNDP
jgi:hypothetical protein